MPAKLESLRLFAEFHLTAARIFVSKVPDSLHTLDLSFSSIQSSAFPILAAGFPTRLRHLNLSHIPIRDAALASIAVYMGGLESLQLANTKLSEWSIKVLSYYLSETLEHLDLSSNKFGSLGAAYLSVCMSQHLKSLNLSSCGLGDAGMAALAPNIPSTLQELNLSSNDIQDAGMVAFSKNVPVSLRILKWNKNRMGPKGMKALCRGLKKSITELGLGSCCSGKEASRVMGAILARLPQLRSLKFYDNELDDVGYKGVMDSIPDTLIDLNLELNAITQFGIISCLGQIKPSLKSLNLSENQIKDKGCLALANDMLARHCDIDLSGNPMSDSVRKYLQLQNHISLFEFSHE
jgi:Ran GTPase-activating protein (RanGAP) involved in mRNA processing and transport